MRDQSPLYYILLSPRLMVIFVEWKYYIGTDKTKEHINENITRSNILLETSDRAHPLDDQNISHHRDPDDKGRDRKESRAYLVKRAVWQKKVI